jgi:uncharacterized protein (TIGR02757 family)
MKKEELIRLLDDKASRYNHPSFIPADPISIAHRFSKKQDIEIAGFFTATLAWGNRSSIINSCTRLMKRMDDAPHDFVLHHAEKDLTRFDDFKHRTFNSTDLLYFIHFLKSFYSGNDSLENAFARFVTSKDETIEKALIGFHNLFFSLEDFPLRTIKHVSTPAKNSACKRLSMFLRWMVRKDHAGVDFGIWKRIKPSQLVCPCDVHVLRVARNLGLVHSKQNNWKTALELTARLKEFDPADPVKYDFALFGLGVIEKY